MEIELTPEQASFVQPGVEQGRFRHAEDAVKDALALWERRERARIELIMSLDIAEREFDAGEGTTYTEGTAHKLADAVELRGLARLSVSK